MHDAERVYGRGLKGRFNYIHDAVKEEYEKSVWRKVVALATVVTFFISLVIVVPFGGHIASWSWRSRLLLTFSIFIAALMIVIEAIYRKTMRERIELQARHSAFKHALEFFRNEAQK